MFAVFTFCFYACKNTDAEKLVGVVKQTDPLVTSQSINQLPIRRRFSRTPGATVWPTSHQIPNANPPWTAELWYHCPRVFAGPPRHIRAREREEANHCVLLILPSALGIQPSPDRPVSDQRLLPSARAHAVDVGWLRERSGRAFASLEGMSGVNQCFSGLLPKSSP